MRILFYILIILFASNNLFCGNTHFPINLFKTIDPNLKPDPLILNKKTELGNLFEGSIEINGRDCLGNEVNILQIWNKDQNALTMIRGFDKDSTIGKLASKLNTVNDDGIRGHFITTGDLNVIGDYFTLRHFFPYNLSLNLFLPIYLMKLKNVCWEEQTQEQSAQNLVLKENLTNDFFKNIFKLGDDLNIKNGWKRTGFGDITTTLEWSQNFPQVKPILKNVHLGLRGGLNIPTGLKKNEDQLFSIPFGNNGMWGIIFGGEIDLTWGSHIRGGLDVEFLQLFGNTKKRRIKTDKDQTELLLLAKVDAFLEPGFNQRYNLYVEAHRIIKGFSARIAYQNLRRSEDKLWICSNDFSNEIANTAQSLDEWTIHQLIFVANYDFANECQNKSWHSNIYFFYKHPFNGKRSVLAKTLGFGIVAEF